MEEKDYTKDTRTIRDTNGQGRELSELLELGKDINWEDIVSYDQLIPMPIRRQVKYLEDSTPLRCPNLRKSGEFFCYCGTGLPNDIKPKFNFFDPIYQKHMNICHIKKFCIGENHEKCPYYKA